jgi:hypothetical protein
MKPREAEMSAVTKLAPIAGVERLIRDDAEFFTRVTVREAPNLFMVEQSHGDFSASAITKVFFSVEDIDMLHAIAHSDRGF